MPTAQWSKGCSKKCSSLASKLEVLTNLFVENKNFILWINKLALTI